jgi:hypothetical protein
VKTIASGARAIKLNRYTVIIDYNGGTYIEQVLAPDIGDVPRGWMDVFLSESPLSSDTEKFIESFDRNNKEYGFIEIKDRIGVWAFDFKFRRKIAYGHVIYSGIVE